ncbi:MAG: RNA polymerase sigma factor [Polyangiaceae bacterium]|nr:RNA polymerase sigma factor [Polyangiaceae bacterium]
MREPETDLNVAMERYANGDEAAFRVLYPLLYPRFVSYFCRMVGRRDAAQVSDLVQETFLRVHRARSLFEKDASALAWVYTIARNVLTDQIRRQKVRTKYAGDLNAEPVDQTANVESQVLAMETARIVERALASMPDAQREAFVLVRYEGLSIKEAAQSLGATETAVKLRAFRAYEILRNALARAHAPGTISSKKNLKPSATSSVESTRASSEPNKS